MKANGKLFALTRIREYFDSKETRGLRPATLFKKKLWHRCFPVNFAKFLRTPFLQNTSGRLLLDLAIPILWEALSLCFCRQKTHEKRKKRRKLHTTFNTLNLGLIAKKILFSRMRFRKSI